MTTATATRAPTAAPSVRLAFAALVVAMLPAVLDQTILATALPTIATDLGTLADVSWLVTVYVVAATATTPLWGKLGDRHGRKRLLQISLGWFVAASALCGFAQDITQLIVMRGVQGIAAGGLMTLAMAAVGDLVSPRERGRYQGYIAAVFAGATVLGPLIGGVLVDHADWRWVFYVNLPLGIAALAALTAHLPSPVQDRREAPLDVSGFALMATATCALMLLCVWGGDRYDWSSPVIAGLALATVALSVTLVVRERRAEDPMLPLAMLRTRSVGIASAGLFLGTASLFAVVVFVPLFLQATTGADPTEAGLLMAPMMLGTVISTNLAGRRIAATGRYRHYPPIGLGLMASGLIGLAAVATERSQVGTGLALVVFGVGFGLVTQVLIVAVQNAVEMRELGTAMGITSFFRALGGSIGAAALGAVFASRTGPTAGQIADAVQTVFIAAVPLAVIAALVVLWLPASELRTERGS